MIRISELRLPVEAGRAEIEKALRKELDISDLHPLTYSVFHRSLDARRGRAFIYLYTIDANLSKEDKVFQKGRKRGKKLQLLKKAPAYELPKISFRPSQRPVIVGLGPAGLFAGLLLSRAGLCPLILERGRRVEERKLDTLRFFTEKILDPDSNVQFGEGGAGTFSDGKVNTLVKDPTLRGRFVLEEMVRCGAPETILYDAKPHIGTDRLQEVVKALREEMIQLGAEIRFETTLTDIHTSADGTRIEGIEFKDRQGRVTSLDTDTVFLGIGHSARDTFTMLSQLGIPMESKPFAVGLRIEHPRLMIDRDQYREYAGSPFLGAASYKLTARAETGRSVYTFCMCPGGLVVAAASEPETVVTNGMSNYARDEVNSNSALLVNITPEDSLAYLPADQEVSPVLSGMYFQRHLERKAFRLGGSDYSAPIQLVGDFLEGTDKISPFGEIQPSFTGTVRQTNLHELFPDYISRSLEEGIRFFGTRMQGFDRPDAVLTGVESRSSSPVRILREADMQSALKGLYPMGEGAGYAGGIMSAAMDGMKAAEAYLTQNNHSSEVTNS